MNFVALIGLIIHIDKINNKYIEMKISSSQEEIYIAKISSDNEDFYKDIEIGKIIGINGIIDFTNNNEIILKNYTLI